MLIIEPTPELIAICVCEYLRSLSTGTGQKYESKQKKCENNYEAS